MDRMRFLKIIFFAFFIFFYYLATGQKKKERLHIIIDSDTANEIDDLFAIIRAIGEPRLELLGITSAQFHTSPNATENTALESLKIGRDLIDLISKYDIPVIVGSPYPLENNNSPQISEASRFIINQAKILPKGEKLHLIILGSCTNVASALLEAPEIRRKVIVSYVGFWHDIKKNSFDKNEFNTNNDLTATNYLLNFKGLDFRVMTATTSKNLVFKKKEAFQKLGDNPLGNYLKNRWRVYNRWWTNKDKEKKRWIMWDLAIIEALIHSEWSKMEFFKTPPENYMREIQIYTAIDRIKMEDDFWKHYKTLIDR